MQSERAGRVGAELSPVVFGAMAHGSAGDDDALRVRTLHAAIDAGITCIDTAPLYQFGRSERVVGDAIVGRRDRVAVWTKVGLRWDAEHGEVLFRTWANGRETAVRKDSRPASIVADVEGSLKRLRIDCIDLCQIHHPDRHTPIAQSIETLLDLRAQGKIRNIGVSNFSAVQVEEAVAALGDVPLWSHQLEYSPVRRDAQAELLPQLQRLGIAGLAYSPLCHGVLSGRRLGWRRLPIDDPRRYHAVFASQNARSLQRTIDQTLGVVAREQTATVAQVALAWVLRQQGLSAVIVGASSPGQAQDTARAGELTLSDEQDERIRSGFEALTLVDKPKPGVAEQGVELGRRVRRRLRRTAGQLRRLGSAVGFGR